MNDKLPPGKTVPEGSHVLVSGATGYTGRVLVKRLVEAGCDVRAIARPTSDLSAFQSCQGRIIARINSSQYDRDEWNMKSKKAAKPKTANYHIVPHRLFC